MNQRERTCLIRKLERQGFDVRVTRRGHLSVKSDGRVVAVHGGTPGDWRSLRNFLAALRRAGYSPEEGGR